MDSVEIVNTAINELIEEFNVRKDYFFNEHDIHHVFYCKLSKLGDLVHPEYPTLKRFVRIRGKKTDETYEDGVHCFDPTVKQGVRGHYDLVVLNKDFYHEYQDNFDKLSNKKVNSNADVNYPFIDVAIEFKYITGTFDPREIDYDIFKLKQADEVKHKKLIIFTRKRETDKNYSKMIESLENLKERENELHVEII